MVESACAVFCSQQIFLHFNGRCGELKQLRCLGKWRWAIFGCSYHRKCMQTFKRLALAYTQRNVSNQSPSTFITYFSFATLSATLTSSTLTRKRSILYQRASDRLHSLRICHCSFEWKIIELFRIERYRKMNTRDGREQVICLLYYYRSHRTCYTCNIVLKHVLYTSHQIRITSGEQIQIDIDFWKVDIYLDLRRNRSLRYVHCTVYTMEH